jgi:hypothetical protein
LLHEHRGGHVGDRRDRKAFEGPELEEDLLQPFVLLGEVLLAANREKSGLDQQQVLLGWTHVPPSAPVAVGVGPAPRPRYGCLLQ